MRIIAVLLLVGLGGVFGTRADDQSSTGKATQSQETWRQEFDQICSKTDDAMTLSQEELTDLVRRCDALAPQIEKLDPSRKKIYTGRLRMCRGLYAYVLDAKRNEKK